MKQLHCVISTKFSPFLQRDVVRRSFASIAVIPSRTQRSGIQLTTKAIDAHVEIPLALHSGIKPAWLHGVEKSPGTVLGEKPVSAEDMETEQVMDGRDPRVTRRRGRISRYAVLRS